jgi:chromosome segregation ATPase
MEEFMNNLATKATGISDNLEQIFSLVEKRIGPAPSRPQGENDKPNWSASLSLVHQAAEAMRVAAQRTQETEARAQDLLRRAREQLESAQARIDALEARLRASENRAQATEARAQEAEDWLRRIHEAITGELPGVLDVVRQLGSPSDENDERMEESSQTGSAF